MIKKMSKTYSLGTHLIIPTLLFASLVVGCVSEKTQDQPHPANDAQTKVPLDSGSHQIQVDSTRGGVGSLSPPRMATADIGQTTVLIEYNAPSVRDRVIWGGLVAYDRVWVTGAHMATSIQFENALRINDQVVPAGKYAFFTIPGRDSWTVILNENWDQHLADEYDQALDLMRLTVKPVQHAFTEQLTYNVSAFPEGGGVVEMMWEELKLSMPLEELE